MRSGNSARPLQSGPPPHPRSDFFNNIRLQDTLGGSEAVSIIPVGDPTGSFTDLPVGSRGRHRGDIRSHGVSKEVGDGQFDVAPRMFLLPEAETMDDRCGSSKCMLGHKAMAILHYPFQTGDGARSQLGAGARPMAC